MLQRNHHLQRPCIFDEPHILVVSEDRVGACKKMDQNMLVLLFMSVPGVICDKSGDSLPNDRHFTGRPSSGALSHPLCSAPSRQCCRVGPRQFFPFNKDKPVGARTRPVLGSESVARAGRLRSRPSQPYCRATRTPAASATPRRRPGFLDTGSWHGLFARGSYTSISH
jgi:hypothetical protein